MRDWYQRSPERYENERKFWLRNNFQEELDNGQVTFVGDLRVSAGSGERRLETRTFRVRVIYPPSFPYAPPDVEFISPAIQNHQHQSAATGYPCLFPSRDWHPLDVRPSEVENAIRRWLRAWMIGSFAREQALYELPEYFHPSPLTILLPSEAMGALNGDQQSGRFAVQQAVGRDLAVLRSIDRVQFGDGLLRKLRFDDSVSTPSRNGKWFRVGGEPPFFKRTGELEAFLREQGQTFAASRTPATQHGLVGLVFWDEPFAQDRFFVLDYRTNAKSKRDPRGWLLRAPQVHVVSSTELFRRLEGLRDIDALASKTTLVLGAGAVGSSLALDLAREGVGRFVVADPDTLRPGNVTRHALDLSSAGQAKADALELAIGRVNPYASTWAQSSDLMVPDILENLMRTNHPLHAPQLIVSAIGDSAVEGLVSEIAVCIDSAPVLFVRTLHHGFAVRVMLLRPGRGDACLHCLELHYREEHPDFIYVPDGQLPEVFDDGCAASSQPGAGLASRHAAVLGAKRALEILQGEDEEDNHWLWVDRPITEAVDVRLHEAERLYTAHLPAHPNCPFCAA